MVRNADHATLGADGPVLRILLGDVIAMGPGKADLLDSIERTGSISAAAKQLGMSYRRAWLLVDAMNRCFRDPVVSAAAGGTRGGGCTLTEAGRDALRRYREMEARAASATRHDFAQFAKLLRPRPARGKR